MGIKLKKVIFFILVNSSFTIGEYDDVMRYVFITDFSDNKWANCKYKNYTSAVDWTSVCQTIASLNNKTVFTGKDDEGKLLFNTDTKNTLDGILKNLESEETQCSEWSYSDEYYSNTGLTEYDWVCDKASLQQLMQV